VLRAWAAAKKAGEPAALGALVLPRLARLLPERGPAFAQALAADGPAPSASAAAAAAAAGGDEEEAAAGAEVWALMDMLTETLYDPDEQARRRPARPRSLFRPRIPPPPPNSNNPNLFFACVCILWRRGMCGCAGAHSRGASDGQRGGGGADRAADGGGGAVRPAGPAAGRLALLRPGAAPPPSRRVAAAVPLCTRRRRWNRWLKPAPGIPFIPSAHPLTSLHGINRFPCAFALREGRGPMPAME
jgi:hypothetical protein